MLNKRHLVSLKMVKIRTLSEGEKQALDLGFRTHAKSYFRCKCQCILLSSEGYLVDALAKLYKVKPRTIHRWIHRYEADGISGLTIVEGRGIKAVLDSISVSEIDTLKQAVDDNPQSLRAVAVDLSNKFGYKVTDFMVHRFLKKT